MNAQQDLSKEDLRQIRSDMEENTEATDNTPEKPRKQKPKLREVGLDKG